MAKFTPILGLIKFSCASYFSTGATSDSEYDSGYDPSQASSLVLRQNDGSRGTPNVESIFVRWLPFTFSKAYGCTYALYYSMPHVQCIEHKLDS